MPEPEVTEPIRCPDCEMLPSESQQFFFDKDTGQILARRCPHAIHTQHDQLVPQYEALANERNELALQLAAMRGCFNMVVNGIQQAFLSGFVEGRKGMTDAEAAWLQSMVKKQAEAALKESERPVEPAE